MERLGHELKLQATELIARPLILSSRSYASEAAMYRKIVVILGLMAVVVGLGVSGNANAADGSRPNVLFILTDDQAPWAIGVSGYPHAVTPHQDRLFREGAYLRNSFTVTPVCSPSRAALISSRFGSEVGITDWIHPKNEATLGLPTDSVTFPQLFTEAGYRTALIGKWHLGTEDQFHPTKFGYQHFMGFRSGGSTPNNPVLEVEGETRKLKGLLPDILTNEALQFMQRDPSRPFLLSLHFRAPHTRWLPVADEDWAPFENLDPTIPNPDYPKLDIPRVKKMTREYLASVASVDRNIGRLHDQLDKLGLAENTVVIYTSDHGYNMGHNGIWHKGNGHWVLTEPPAATENIPKGQRPNMYDHSIRVPTGIRWPGVIKPGTVIDHTVANIDWFPTLLSMAGIEAPSGLAIRGRDITPLLRGENVEWNNDLFCQYSTHHQSRTHMRMLRANGWKLIRDFRNEGRDELYNLEADPAEAHNLIDATDPAARQAVADLNKKLLARMREIGDPVLLDAD
jgi:choline-sulfatase